MGRDELGSSDATGWAAVLGDAIRSARASRGLSLTRLADLVGCAKSYLSEIELGRRRSPPSETLVGALESSLQLERGRLERVARVGRTPPAVVAELEDRDRAGAELRRIVRSGGVDLDELAASGELGRLVDRLDPAGAGGKRAPTVARTVARTGLVRQVPLINSVAAGVPAEFTDLGLPAGVASEYVACPDLDDPDAFAARVVGDSMSPAYAEGDVVVFSPAKPVRDGSDCFARLEPDHEATFKRVYFAGEPGAEMIRLQPLNGAYESRTVPRERVAGLYAAARLIRPLP